MAAKEIVKKSVSKSTKVKKKASADSGAKKAAPKPAEAKQVDTATAATAAPAPEPAIAPAAKKAANKKTNGVKKTVTAVKVASGKAIKPGIQPEEIQLLISKRAYYKWEKAGCPDVAGEGFWLEAEQEIIEIFS